MSINIDKVTTTIDDHIIKISTIINKKNICMEKVKKINERIEEIKSNNEEVLEIKIKLVDKEKSLKDTIKILKIYKQKSYLQKLIDEIQEIINISDKNLVNIHKLKDYHAHINKKISDNFFNIILKKLSEIKNLFSQDILKNKIELIYDKFNLISKNCENKEEFLEELKIESININKEYKETIKELKEVLNKIKKNNRTFIYIFRVINFDESYHSNEIDKLYEEKNYIIEEEEKKKNIAQLYTLLIKFINDLDFCKIKQLINLINNKLIILQKLEQEQEQKLEQEQEQKLEQEQEQEQEQEIIDEICELIIIPDKKLINSIAYTKNKLKEQNIYENENEIDKFFNTEIKLHNEIVNELIEKISKPQEILNYNKIINFVTKKLNLIIEKCKNKEKLIIIIKNEAAEAISKARETRIKVNKIRNKIHTKKTNFYKAGIQTEQQFFYLTQEDQEERINKILNVIDEKIEEENTIDKQLDREEEKIKAENISAETDEYIAQLKIYKVKYINELNYNRIKELFEKLIQKLIKEKDKKLYLNFYKLRKYVIEHKTFLSINKIFFNKLFKIIKLKPLEQLEQLEQLEPLEQLEQLELLEPFKPLEQKYEQYILDNKQQIITYLENTFLHNNKKKYDNNLNIKIYSFLILLKDPINFKEILISFDEIYKIINTAEKNYKNNISKHVLPNDVDGYYDVLFNNFEEFKLYEIKNKFDELELDDYNKLELDDYNKLELEKKIIKLIKNKVSIISEKCNNKEKFLEKIDEEIKNIKIDEENNNNQLYNANKNKKNREEEENRKYSFVSMFNTQYTNDIKIIDEEIEKVKNNIEHIKKYIILTEYKKIYIEELDICKIQDLIEKIEILIEPKSKKEEKQKKIKKNIDQIHKIINRANYNLKSNISKVSKEIYNNSKYNEINTDFELHEQIVNENSATEFIKFINIINKKCINQNEEIELIKAKEELFKINKKFRFYTLPQLPQELTKYKIEYILELDYCKIQELIEEIETILKPKTKEEEKQIKIEKKIKKIHNIINKANNRLISYIGQKILEEEEKKLKYEEINTDFELHEQIVKESSPIELKKLLSIINQKCINQNEEIELAVKEIIKANKYFEDAEKENNETINNLRKIIKPTYKSEIISESSIKIFEKKISDAKLDKNFKDYKLDYINELDYCIIKKLIEEIELIINEN